MWVRHCSGDQMRSTDKKKLLQIYNIKKRKLPQYDPTMKPTRAKIVVPIKPHTNTHTPDHEPWLYLSDVLPKTVHDLRKEMV